MENGHYSGNQFVVDGHRFYDTDLLVYTTALVSNIKSLFDVDIHLNDDVKKKAAFYKGKQVFGNSHMPQGAYIKPIWGKYEVYEQYDFVDLKGCTCGYNKFLTKEEVIEFVKHLADFVNNNDVLSIGFYKKITYYSMPSLINGQTIAKALIMYYEPFVNISNGVNEFIKMAYPYSRLDKKEVTPKFLEVLDKFGFFVDESTMKITF